MLFERKLVGYQRPVMIMSNGNGNRDGDDAMADT